jgi:hypothetical protein
MSLRENTRPIEYYNNEQHHESSNTLTPVDMNCGRAREIETRREKIKRETLQQRRRYYRLPTHTTAINVEIPRKSLLN